MKVLALNSVEVLELHGVAVEAGAAHATAELVLFSSWFSFILTATCYSRKLDAVIIMIIDKFIPIMPALCFSLYLPITPKEYAAYCACP